MKPQLFGKLTTAAGAVALSRVANTAAGVGTNIVLAWILGKASNGLLQKAFVVTQIAVLAGSFGIQTSLYYFLPRAQPGDKRALAAQSFFILTGLGLLLGAGIYFCAPLFAVVFSTPELSVILKWGAVAVVLTLPASVYEPILITEGRPWAAAGVSGIAAFLQIAFTAFFILRFRDVELVFLAVSLSQVLRLIIGGGMAYFGLPSGRGLPAAGGLVAQQFSYILPIGITAVIDTLSTWLDRTLVSFFYAPAQLAVYTYGAFEVPFIGILIGALTPVLLPQFSKMLNDGNPAAVIELWHRAIRKTAIILFGVFFVLLWIAPEFLTTLYSARYYDSTPYFRIYLLLLPIRIVSFMPILFALGRNRLVMIGALADILLNLFISVILMRIVGLGMAGAAWGTILATIWQSMFYLSGIRAALDLKWQNVLPWRGLGADLALTGVFFSIFIPIPKYLGLPGPLVVLAAGAMYAIFAGHWILPRLRNQTA